MGYFDDTHFDSIDEMMDAINEVVERNIYNMTTRVQARDLGLDERAGHSLLVTEDAIIVTAAARRMLDYYGGFEYVDASCINVIGDYVMYSAEDGRVQECLNVFYGNDEDDPMDDFNYVGHPAHY